MIVRPATPADIPALHALIERAYRGEEAKTGWTSEAHLIGGQRTDVGQLEAMLADAGTTILVAAEAQALIGCVLVADRGAHAYLGMLTVDPKCQGAGLGDRLTRAAEDHARALGRTRIEMRVIRQRPELIAYYTRRGYVDTGVREPFPYGDPAIGVPVRDDLEFVILAKPLGEPTPSHGQ